MIRVTVITITDVKVITSNHVTTSNDVITPNYVTTSQLSGQQRVLVQKVAVRLIERVRHVIGAGPDEAERAEGEEVSPVKLERAVWHGAGVSE